MSVKHIYRVVVMCIIALLLITGAFFMIYKSLDRKISIETMAVMGRLGIDDYYDLRHISITGMYSQPFRGSDTFNGEFIIDGFNFTSDGSIVAIHANKNYGSNMMYINLKGLSAGSDVEVNHLGIIFFSPRFEQFSILVFEETGDTDSLIWSKESGLFLSAPASCRHDSIEILRKLTRTSLIYGNINFK